MTHITIVEPGQSNVVASGPQFGVKYTMIGPDGSRAVFNDPSDPDYIGMISDIAGLDSPEVREAADDLVGDDGGVHGPFFYGRRPVVIEGMIDNRPAPHHYRMVGDERVDFDANEVRNVRMTVLQRTSNAMRANAQLRWRPEGGAEQTIFVRRQQPLRLTGGFNKSFQLAVVSADPRIYSAEIQEQRFNPNVHDETVTNDGTMRTPPSITIYGPASNIEVHNHTTGEYTVFGSYTLAAGSFITISYRNRTIMLNGTTNLYSAINFASTVWWELVPGENVLAFHATGTTGASNMLVRWQDAWV